MPFFFFSFFFFWVFLSYSFLTTIRWRCFFFFFYHTTVITGLSTSSTPPCTHAQHFWVLLDTPAVIICHDKRTYQEMTPHFVFHCKVGEPNDFILVVLLLVAQPHYRQWLRLCRCLSEVENRKGRTKHFLWIYYNKCGYFFNSQHFWGSILWSSNGSETMFALTS